MAVKIFKHGHEPEPQKFAIEFNCPYCHCDFYAGVSVAKALNVTLFYLTKCPECGSHVESHDEPVLREEVFDD